MIPSDSPFVLRLQAQLNEYLRLMHLAQPDCICSFASLAARPDLLHLLVEILFSVSLQRDEGRPIRGAIALCSAIEAPRSRSLAKPAPFTSPALATLLTASPVAPLGVFCDAGDISIWGFVDDVPLQTLLLRVADTGMLVAFDRTSTVAVFERGDIHLPKRASPFDWVGLVSQALGDVRPFKERLMLASRLRHVVEAVHAHGHGGAVVVLPPRSEAIGDIAIAYSLGQTGSEAICSCLAELEDVQAKRAALGVMPAADVVAPQALSLLDQSIETHQQLLQRALSRTGHFSSIDGALIVDEDLRILGFGAKLHASAASGITVTVVDALSHEIKDCEVESLGGTRHQSAAHFVAAHLDSMVFVASQDGRLSLFVGVLSTKRVAVFRRLEHFLWAVQRTAD